MVVQTFRMALIAVGLLLSLPLHSVATRQNLPNNSTQLAAQSSPEAFAVVESSFLERKVRRVEEEEDEEDDKSDRDGFRFLFLP